MTFYCYYYFLAMGHVEYLIPDQGLSPESPALDAWSLNHWPLGKSHHCMTF